MLAMRVDGLLISASQERPHLGVYQKVKEMKVPLVFFDRRIPDLGFKSVTIDDQRGAYEAVRYLINKGYTRIAHVAGTEQTEIGLNRLKGFQQAMKDSGLEIPECWIIKGGFDESHGYNAFKRLLQSDEIPDAIFAVTFPVGVGIRGAIREHAPELINKVTLLTFGDGGLNAFYLFPQYCVRQPTEEMGREAFLLLLNEIQQKETSNSSSILLNTRLLKPGESKLVQ